MQVHARPSASASPAGGLTRSELTGRHDRALLQRLRRRDPSALVELYDTYVQHALLAARHILHDEAAVQEAVESGFADVWQESFDLRIGDLYRPLLRAVHRHAVALRVAANGVVDPAVPPA